MIEIYAPQIWIIGVNNTPRAPNTRDQVCDGLGPIRHPVIDGFSMVTRKTEYRSGEREKGAIACKMREVEEGRLKKRVDN